MPKHNDWTSQLTFENGLFISISQKSILNGLIENEPA